MNQPGEASLEDGTFHWEWKRCGDVPESRNVKYNVLS